MNDAAKKISDKMDAIIAGLSDEQLLAAINDMNKKYEDYTLDEHTIRSRMLNSYETRHGGEAVEVLMDKLDALVGE
jgi:hypothetical protein